ncbi:MAG: TraR/DksA C4-type zinc finger protein [Cyanobacteria bacterium REEB65]|nr:TraR/DksA C4-type zinc finger protein [Cyanobacteria bacterium REEB65]
MIDLGEMRDRLEAERSRLRTLLGWANAALQAHEAQSIMESATQSGDDEYADNASETFSQELDATLRQRFMESLVGVEAALQRLEVGEYGHCARCGKPIPESRLRVVPQTPFCIACGREQEAEG